jgi:hypothetical protein
LRIQKDKSATGTPRNAENAVTAKRGIAHITIQYCGIAPPA